jgi:hypothetical protein
MLDFNSRLTTSRLYISHLDPSNDAHCDFIYELLLSPGIVNELSTADVEQSYKTMPREAGSKFIADSVGKMERTGYGRYVIFLRPSPAIDTSLHRDSEITFSQNHFESIGVVSMQ